MAENYGTLEGTLDEHGVLSGEMSDRATLEGEIQFGSGGGGVLDVYQNGQSVVQGRYAYVTVPTFLKDLRSDDYHNTVTTLEIQKWNGKADPSDIPTALSQLDNDANYVQDADYVHTDNNFTDEDKAAIGNIPENITDLSDVAVDNIQNGQVLKWDATQNKFVNANESGGGGDITDVKVDGISVVDPVTGEADIDLSGKADKALDAVAGDFAVLLANGNYANSGKSANDMASKAEMSVNTSGTQTTVQLKNGTSATINNPTITIQKNGQNVDTFTLNQTANKVIDISVPTKTSDLQNDSSFIDNTVNNLANYYLKTQTYTQTEVDALIDAAINGRFQKVNVLPATGEPNVIYLVPKATPETSNACDEYIWQDNAWELIGSTDIDLSGYVTDDELNTALADYLTTSAFNTAIANYYTKTEIGNMLDDKVDKVSGKGLSTNDYDNTAKGIVDGVTSALAGKVDKETGKGLSTNDYTTNDKNKLAGIAAGATKTASSTTNGNIKINDVETQVYDDSEIQDKIDETTTSISGNPISISDLKANQLAKDPIITFEPIQDLHGQSKPYPAGGGLDLLQVTSDKFTTLTCNVTVDGDNSFTITSTGSYYPSASMSLENYKSYGRLWFYCKWTGTAPAPSVKLYDGGTYILDLTSGSVVNRDISNMTEPRLIFYVYSSNTGESGKTIKVSEITISKEAITGFVPYSNICPISGYDKVEALSCGKNIWDGTFKNTYLENGTTYKSDSSCRTAIIRVKANTYYTIYKNGGTRFVVAESTEYPVENGVYNKLYERNGATTVTQTVQTSANIKYLIVYCTNDNTSNIQVQCEEGQTATTYEAPNKTTSISESLGQTVYWLTHTVRTGVSKVLGQLLANPESLNWQEGARTVFYAPLTSGVGGGVSSHYAFSNLPYQTMDDLTWYTYNNYIYVRNTNYTGNMNGFKASLSGVQFVYPLATPTEIQLTPYEISLLKDYAYLSTNGTNIALDYHNGELASLADVSQLGETVNELGDYVGRNNAYSYVDLTSISYEFPNDGYIVVDSQAVTSGAVRVQLTGYNGSFAIGGIYMNITGAYQIQTTFVKKGMRARVIQDVTGVRKRFVPLV